MASVVAWQPVSGLAPLGILRLRSRRRLRCPDPQRHERGSSRGWPMGERLVQHLGKRHRHIASRRHRRWRDRVVPHESSRHRPWSFWRSFRAWRSSGWCREIPNWRWEARRGWGEWSASLAAPAAGRTAYGPAQRRRSAQAERSLAKPLAPRSARPAATTPYCRRTGRPRRCPGPPRTPDPRSATDPC